MTLACFRLRKPVHWSIRLKVRPLPATMPNSLGLPRSSALMLPLYSGLSPNC